MDGKSDRDVRNTPDSTLDEQQFQFLSVLANIKKEPIDDWESSSVNERLPLQSDCSSSVLCDIRIKSEPESSPRSKSPCKVTSDQRPLESGRSTPLCINDIRVNTKDPESRLHSKLLGQVTPDEKPMESACCTAISNSDVRIKSENQESRRRSKPICKVTPDGKSPHYSCNSDTHINTGDSERRPHSKPICQVTAGERPRKRASKEMNPFLIEKLELISKRIKLEPPDTPATVVDDKDDCSKLEEPATVDDDKDDGSKLEEPATERVFKMIPIAEAKALQQIRSAENKTIKLIPIAEAKALQQIRSAENKTVNLSHIAEAKALKLISEVRKTKDLKEHQSNESVAKRMKSSPAEVFFSTSNVSEPIAPACNSKSETESFSIDVMKFFNVDSVIDKSGIDLLFKYVSKDFENNSFELFYERKRLGGKEKPKVFFQDSVQETLRTTNEQYQYFGLKKAPLVKSSATKPICNELLEVSTFKDRKADAVSTELLQPRNNSAESNLPKPYSSENRAAKSVAKPPPQIMRVSPVVVSSNELSKTVLPVSPDCVRKSIPSVYDISIHELHNILSNVQPGQSPNATVNLPFNVKPSANVIAGASEIANRPQGGNNSAQPSTIPLGSSRTGRRIPVVNRFLDMENVD